VIRYILFYIKNFFVIWI